MLEGMNRHLWNLMRTPPTLAPSSLSNNMQHEVEWGRAGLVLKTLW